MPHWLLWMTNSVSGHCVCYTYNIYTYIEDWMVMLCICMYSRTWIVSTLKGRKNRYSLSEVLTIQGAFNGIA